MSIGFFAIFQIYLIFSCFLSVFLIFSRFLFCYFIIFQHSDISLFSSRFRRYSQFFFLCLFRRFIVILSPFLPEKSFSAPPIRAERKNTALFKIYNSVIGNNSPYLFGIYGLFGSPPYSTVYRFNIQGRHTLHSHFAKLYPFALVDNRNIILYIKEFSEAEPLSFTIWVSLFIKLSETLNLFLKI